jgi:hypothetical protein
LIDQNGSSKHFLLTPGVGCKILLQYLILLY